VTSQVTDPGSGYAFYDGTSMATPHVSAVAALVWSYNTSWSASKVRTALEKSAEDLGTAGRDNNYGFGLVRAKAALDYAIANP
jgi:serine protease